MNCAVHKPHLLVVSKTNNYILTLRQIENNYAKETDYFFVEVDGKVCWITKGQALTILSTYVNWWNKLTQESSK